MLFRSASPPVESTGKMPVLRLFDFCKELGEKENIPVRIKHIMAATLIVISALGPFGLPSAMGGPPPGAPTSADPEAWEGLTHQAKERIKNGEIIIANQRAQIKEGGQMLIQAAVIFNVGIDDAFKIVKQTEKQCEFMTSCHKSTLVERTGGEDRVDFEVKLLMWSIKYRVRHHWDDKRYYIWWSLDPEYDNDIVHLEGFWKLYYMDDSHTLARFGTKLIIKQFIPRSVQD